MGAQKPESHCYSSYKDVKEAASRFHFVLPECVRGMKELNRDLFNTSVPVLGLRVEGKNIGLMVARINACLMNVARLRNVVPDPEAEAGDVNKKLVLLSPIFTKEDLSELPEDARAFIKECGATVTRFVQDLDYSYWRADQVIASILPEDIKEITTSFETVGHIAHMNLRDCHLPYRHLIGQVILDKNPKIKTVVNKLDNIDTTFRFFKMEVLAGENNFMAVVNENGCSFHFDYSSVYWNTRLGTEHGRLLRTFKKDDVVCDMFAGVGPFVIPACKKGCYVYGNDLNPASYQAMVENAKINKLKPSKFKLYNLDAREFVKKVVSDLKEGTSTQVFNQVVMNLPCDAIEFLDAFVGLYEGMKEGTILPMINCYCFSKDENPQEDAVKRVQAVLKTALPFEYFTVYDVRNVAPQKLMMCVSFPLPEEVARRITGQEVEE
eukprot:Ihof_evm10s67 gene=Ihof_evmTU10s67